MASCPITITRKNAGMRDGGYTSQGGWRWFGSRFGGKESEGGYAFTPSLGQSHSLPLFVRFGREADIRNRDMVPTPRAKEGNMRPSHYQRLCSQRD